MARPVTFEKSWALYNPRRRVTQDQPKKAFDLVNEPKVNIVMKECEEGDEP